MERREEYRNYNYHQQDYIDNREAEWEERDHYRDSWDGYYHDQDDTRYHRYQNIRYQGETFSLNNNYIYPVLARTLVKV